MADVDEIRAFMRTTEAHFDEKKELAESHAEVRNDFVERTALNKTGLGFCARLNRLSAEKRDDVLRTLDEVREAMAPVWGQQPDMFPPEKKTVEEQAEANKRARTSAKRDGATRRAKEQPEPEKPSAEVTPFPPAWDPAESDEPTAAA
ncbi:MAG: hypothetical protein KAX54_00105 [Thauera sp.]|nr:hypothetical protein [Thauera sp.]